MGVMDRRTFWGFLLKRMAITFLSAYPLIALPSELIPKIFPTNCFQKNEPSRFLRDIYDEVQKMGGHGDGNFIKREFHLNLDDNESNKEEHVVVLNHFYSGRNIMLLQVTYFESERENSLIKYAKMTREIECCVLDKGVEIRRCDYDTVEIRELLPNILKGIRQTKKYLHRIR